MQDERFKFYVERVKALFNQHQIPTTRLEANCRDGLSNKSHLKLLGLSDSNDYRKVIPLPQTFDSLPLAYQWLNAVKFYLSEYNAVELVDFQYIKVGNSTMRIFKAAEPVWDRLKFHSTTQRLVREINDLRREQEYALIGVKKGEPFDYESMTYQHFMIAYGEYVKNGLVAVISANPWDYLVLSDYSGKWCSYSSCVRYNDDSKGQTGEYFNTTLCYLRSDGVYVGYVADAKNIDRKIGRFIVYIGGWGRDATTVTTGREYGTCPKGSSLAIRDYIQHCIYNQTSLFPEEHNRWKIYGRITREVVDSHSVAYIDYEYGTVTHLKSENVESVTVENGSCLECGDELDSDYGGTCDMCKCVCCADCGNRIRHNDEHHMHGAVFCDNCFRERYEWCEDCESYIDTENMVDIYDGRGNTFRACQSCADNKYDYCTNCNKYFTECGTDIDGDQVCRDCILNDYTECCECGEYFPNDDNRLGDLNGKPCCEECLSQIEEVV